MSPATQRERTSEWQPIETAPMDGTDVLGWREDCGIMLVRYTSPEEFLSEQEIDELEISEDDACSQAWFCADIIAGCRLDGDERPTHWMPLPAPPAMAKRRTYELGDELKTAGELREFLAEHEGNVVTDLDSDLRAFRFACEGIIYFASEDGTSFNESGMNGTDDYDLRYGNYYVHTLGASMDEGPRIQSFRERSAKEAMLAQFGEQGYEHFCAWAREIVREEIQRDKEGER